MVRIDFTRALPHELQNMIIAHVADGPGHVADLRAVDRHLCGLTAPCLDRMVQLGEVWHNAAAVAPHRIDFAPREREAGIYTEVPPAPAGLNAEHAHLFSLNIAETSLKEFHLSRRRSFAPRLHPRRDDLVLQMQLRDVRVFQRQGTILETLRVHPLAPWSPRQREEEEGFRSAWHPEGDYYMYVDYDGPEAVLRRVHLDGEVLLPWRLPGAPNKVSHLAFSPSGQLAVVGDETLFVLDAAGQCLDSRPYVVENGCLTWAQQGRILAYQGADCRIDFVDFSESQPQVIGSEAISRTMSQGGLTRVAWHPSSLGYAIIDFQEVRVASFDRSLPKVSFSFADIGLHPADVRAQDVAWAPSGGNMLLAVMVSNQVAIVSPWKTGPQVWRNLATPSAEWACLDWSTPRALEVTLRGREGFGQLRIADVLGAAPRSE